MTDRNSTTPRDPKEKPSHPKPPGGTTEPGGLHVKKQGRTTDNAGPRGQQDGRPERQNPK